ncbi:MAG: hydroxyacylglutathione hydrolase [Parvicella sp.]|jgi:hydroxyacylglutathione hydrolase
MLIKSALLMTAVLLVYSASGSTLTPAGEPEVLADVHTWSWRHGRENCETSQDPAIEVLQVNARSYILRQDKCSHFEAPFIYLLVGNRKALLFDTGATANAEVFPIFQTVLELVNRLSGPNTIPIEEIIVMHSHHHRDHYAGDEQFAGQQKITLVAPDRESLASQFGLSVAATHEVEFNLGGRNIKLIPIPGHQRDSVALFDQQTGWLLTGDTLYPGSIRVKDWAEFKMSIHRLSAFTEQHQVSAILGGHVEMRSDMPKIYRIGSTFQPKELPLALRVDELVELNKRLVKTKKPKTLRFQKFIISPLNFFERQLMKVLSHNAAQSKLLQPEAFSNVGTNFETDLSRLGVSKGLSTDQRANPFISHQFQQQGVIDSPVDDV